jgi:hypothetical protein
MALVLLALAAAVVVLLYAEAQREKRLPETRVEVEEYSDWQWPNRQAGPVGRTRLP